MLQTGEAEVLLDDTLRFAEKAKQAGVEVELDTWPDMPHVFQGFAPFLPQASEAIERIGGFFKTVK
jgi:acetyl esterase/lipase